MLIGAFSWVGAGLLNLFVPFKAVGEPAPTSSWEWCNISDKTC